MKTRMFFTLVALFASIASYSQQKVTVKCPDCGHLITISINVDGSAEAAHDTIQSNNAGQCKAITQKGTQCSRKAQNGSDYCWQHADKAGKTSNSSSSTKSSSTTSSSGGGRCRATTKSGSRCSRTAKSNGYCWQHGG